MNHPHISTRKLLDDYGYDINEMTEALICKADRFLQLSPNVTYDRTNVVPVAHIMATLLLALIMTRGGAK
jgi:hypothetical protein